MPVLDKERHRLLLLELNNRWDTLNNNFKVRELKNSHEGLNGRGCWNYSELKCSTIGNKEEISLAISDFKSILYEIKILK